MTEREPGRYQRDVAVVPGVVVHQRGSVSHAGDLVAVVPPGHDAGVLVRVLPQPIVGLPEVVQDVPGPTGQTVPLTQECSGGFCCDANTLIE